MKKSKDMLKRLLSYIYHIFFKYILKDDYKSEMGRWFFQNGDSKYLLGHDLNASSVVFDVGGYKGIFTDKLVNKFDAKLYVFEPVMAFYEVLKGKYKNNAKVSVYDYGLSGRTKSTEIGVKEDSSSVFLDSNTKETIKLVDVQQFVQDEGIKEVDLITINIEGGEYELLKRMIESGIVGRFRYIQVQFHNFVEDAEKKREEIISLLKKTHKVTFSFPFIWEGFELR